MEAGAFNKLPKDVQGYLNAIYRRQDAQAGLKARDLAQILEGTDIKAENVPEEPIALLAYVKTKHEELNNKINAEPPPDNKEELEAKREQLESLQLELQRAVTDRKKADTIAQEGKPNSPQLLRELATQLGAEVKAEEAETETPPHNDGKPVKTQSGGDEKPIDEWLMKDKEYREKYKEVKLQELERQKSQMQTQNTTEKMGLAATAVGIGAGIGGGFGGPGGGFLSTASVGPGGSSFGVASGGGGFGHVGLAPFGAPAMIGIASGGFGGPGLNGAMGPGDLLFNIGAPMMMSGAGGLGEDIRRQNAKLEALINFLLMQILSGNTDAITSALIAISRKSKGTLILSSVAMLSAMKQYDKQQGQISDTFQKLQFDPGNPDSMANFQHQSQNLSMQLNSIAVARQMLMNQMRDVLTMTEEIGNVEKSVLDIVGQFKRHYSRFNV